MSIATLETMIWHECQNILQNKKMKKKDLMEWSTDLIIPQDREIVLRIEHLGIYAAVPAELDKRIAT